MVPWSTLLLKVTEIFAASAQVYGSPRITRALAADGLMVGRRRVIAAMQALGLVARRGTKSALRGNRKNGRRIERSHEFKRCVAPDLIRRSFTARSLNRRWATDVSDLGFDVRHRFLCVVVDLASRRVVGWRCGPSPNTSLVIATLRACFRDRLPTSGLIVHSDRGGEYANHRVRELLLRHGATPSMSRRGNCWDNAVVESLFATLKRECIYLLGRETVETLPATLTTAVGEYFNWYNQVRLHSALGYQSPDQVEIGSIAISRK
ncbi:MAG TPA: IS3 family transposase [Myxococcota bacterium]|nr:IS3 family transposase [Myxococcota bacterium]